VELTKDGVTERIELRIDNDWVDPKVFKEIETRLVIAGSSRRFMTHDLGQDCLLICKTPEQTREINRVTGLRFGKLNM
jgi:hypothetical protein